MLEQRNRGEEASHLDGEKSIPGKLVQKTVMSLICSKNSEEASTAGWEQEMVKEVKGQRGEEADSAEPL